MKRSKFFKALAKLAADIDKHNIKYSNHFRGSWGSIKKHKSVNCVSYVAVAMVKGGLFKKAPNFYCKDGKLRGKGAKKIRKKCKVREHVNSKLSVLVKNGKLKPGDIVGAQHGAHTMVFQGVIDGKYTFYSVGPKSLTVNKITKNHRSGDYVIGVIIRPKYSKGGKTLAKKKVALFVGHGIQTSGKYDSGCIYGKYTEAGLMVPIAKYAVYYLKKSGIEVITDYPKNNINMVAQVRKSNAVGVALHVALHCDYMRAPSGTLPLYVSSDGKKAATYMNQYVVKEVGIKTRGVGKRTDLYELNATKAPAVIFECGSIKADLKTMQKKPKQYGKGIAEGICKYLGVKFKG